MGEEPDEHQRGPRVTVEPGVPRDQVVDDRLQVGRQRRPTLREDGLEPAGPLRDHVTLERLEIVGRHVAPVDERVESVPESAPPIRRAVRRREIVGVVVVVYDPLVGGADVLRVPGVWHLRVRDRPFPRGLPERGVAGPLTLAGGAVEHPVTGDRLPVGPADRHLPGDAVEDLPVTVGVHTTLGGFVEPSERARHVLDAARTVEVAHRECGVRRRQPGPRDADGRPEVVTVRRTVQHDTVDRPPDGHGPVVAVGDGDRLLVRLEGAPLVAVAVLRPVGTRLVAVTVEHVRVGVGEPPRAVVVLADDDRRHPRERHPPDAVVGR